MDIKTRILIGALLARGALCRPRGLGERQFSVSIGVPSSSSVGTSIGLPSVSLSAPVPTSIGTSVGLPSLTSVSVGVPTISIGTSVSIPLPPVSLSVPVPTISGSIPLPTGISGTIPSTTASLNWSLPTGIPPTVSTSTGFSVSIPVPSGLNTSVTLAPTVTLPTLSLPTTLLPTTSIPVPTTIPTAAPVPTTTNPYSLTCPIPSNFIVNDFTYEYGPPPLNPYGHKLTVKFGDLELKCPIRPGAWTSRYGFVSLDCDDAGLVTAVVEVGRGGVHFNYEGYCGDVKAVSPTNSSSPAYGTLIMQTPTLDISPFLTCEYPDPQQPAIRKCKQEVDDFAIGSGKFYEGTATGKSFLPVGVDGVWVKTCPTIQGVNPVLSDRAKCIHVGEEN